MAVIFSFSAKNAVDSTEDSHSIGAAICRAFVPDFDNRPSEEQQTFVENIDYAVRKTAHAAEYAILGILVFGALGKFSGLKQRWAIAWGIAIAYAVSDEIHQYFVPGRACRITDVGIDAGGALAGVLLAVLIKHIAEHFTGRKEKKA